MKREALLLGLALLLTLTNGCKKLERDNPLDGFSLPTVLTYGVRQSRISVECGGEVSDEGSLSVVSKGVCWNTSGNPTIDDNKTIDGSGIGPFKSIMTGLNANTEYFVRAYATCDSGTVYGEEGSFIRKCYITEYESYSINYESVDDHKITPGENLRVGIDYKQNECLWSVDITISTTSAYAVCESGSAHLSDNDVILHWSPTYPDATPSTGKGKGFLIQISDDAPIGTVLNVNVTMTDCFHAQSYGSFTLTVGSSW